MKTTIFNKTYNVPISIESEQFVKIGADLDMYSYQSAKVRSSDTMSASIIDIVNCMHSDIPRAFLIETDATGDYSFTGGTAEDFGDSTNLPYALYDSTSFDFIGFYRLDTAGAIVHIAGADDIANDSTYVARVLTDTPFSLLDGAVKAYAAFKSAVAKGMDKILSMVEVTDTTAQTLTVTFKVLANQYTFELASVKYAVIDSKFYKRLQFPFHTTFEGSFSAIGTEFEEVFTLDTNTRFILMWFKDIYGNVSYPLVYVVNP
jgi:hypothetical protein